MKVSLRYNSAERHYHSTETVGSMKIVIGQESVFVIEY